MGIYLLTSGINLEVEWKTSYKQIWMMTEAKTNLPVLLLFIYE